MAASDGPLVALSDAALHISDDAFASADWTLDLAVSYDFESTLDTEEVTNFDSSGEKEYLGSNLDATLGGTLLYDPSDTLGYEKLWDFYENGTLFNWRYIPTDNEDGDQYWHGDGYVTRIGQPVSQGERIEVPFEIQVSGGVQKDLQDFVGP